MDSENQGSLTNEQIVSVCNELARVFDLDIEAIGPQEFVGRLMSVFRATGIRLVAYSNPRGEET